MKLLLGIVFLFIIKIELVVAQAGTWQQITVGDSTTVDFPHKPRQILHKGQTAYGLYEEEVLHSVAIRANAADAGFTVEEKHHLYDEAMKGAAEAAKASQIISKTRFMVNGFEGLEATLVSTIAKVKNPVVTRMVLVNGTLYAQMFSASASPAHTAARQHFFASFAPRLHPAAATPAETHTTAYKVGQLLGEVFVYGAIIAGIIFLVMRSTAKKKNAPVS